MGQKKNGLSFLTLKKKIMLSAHVDIVQKIWFF